MGAKVIFTDYQICGEIMSFNEGRKLVFPITDARNTYNGVKVKVVITAFDEAASKLARLKAKKGSVIDLTCDLVPFLKGKDVEIGYKLNDFSYSEGFKYRDSEVKTDTEPEKTEEEKKEERMMKAAHILETNPFGVN